jgi:hypothetical protein
MNGDALALDGLDDGRDEGTEAVGTEEYRVTYSDGSLRGERSEPDARRGRGRPVENERKRQLTQRG